MIKKWVRLVFATCILSVGGYLTGQTLGVSVSPRRGSFTEEREPTIRQHAADDAHGLNMPDGPATWIPFTADVVVVEHGGKVQEKYYRNSENSRRVEAFSPFTSDILITIHNMSERMTYYRDQHGMWSSTPLLPSMVILTPPQRPMLPRNGKVELLEKGIEGRTAYKISTASQDVVVVPELNYLDVRTELRQAGKVREFSNIRVGEPAANLFVPPTGVSVRRVSNPRELWSNSAKK